MARLSSVAESDLCAGLDPAEARLVAAMAREKKLGADEVVFRLGDETDTLYVIRAGRVELTFPLTVKNETKEVRFESLEAGSALAWSGMVPPHRLTMSARAATDVELYVFSRPAMLVLFAEKPRIGFAVMSNLARVIGARLQAAQVLWLREVQRSVSATYR